MEKFSVLISVYYKENVKFLKESLSSVFNQSAKPTEVVLVKDGPLGIDLDNLIEEFQKKYSFLKVVALPKNLGLGNALNAGLKECRYDLIARMDTDDIAKPERFEKQIQIFKKYPEIDIVSSWIDEFLLETDNIISVKKLPEYHEDIYKYAKKRCPINHPVVMFRKKAVLDAGSYRHFPLFEDYDLWIRMLLNNSKFYNIQESLLSFRASNDMYMRRGGLSYFKKEVALQRSMLNSGFINYIDFIFNLAIRFSVRMIPNNIRSSCYKLIRRKR